MNRAITLLLLAATASVGVGDTRIANQIYYNVEVFGHCFVRANATTPVGCSSSSGGNVGVLQFIESDGDIRSLLADVGAYAPYIAVMYPKMFTMETLQRLERSDAISGVILLSPMQPKPDQLPPSFSPEQSCPNRPMDYYAFRKSLDFANCRRQVWNDKGSSILYRHWRFPIFIIRRQRDIRFLMQDCYRKFNTPTKGSKLAAYPLCSAELTAFMNTATNSETCYKRSLLLQNPITFRVFCDPMGSSNVVSYLNPITKPPKKDSIILVTARSDMSPLFMDNADPFILGLSVGADTTVSGLVGLVAVAEALSHVRSNVTDKDVVFVAVNGDALDYLGSMRLGYDMNKRQFPHQPSDGVDADQLAVIEWDHVDLVIDLTQIGVKDESGSLFLHTDVLSASTPNVSSRITEFVDAMDAVAVPGVAVRRPDPNQPLPPSTLHAFLRYRNMLPGVVLADFENNFNNPYYMGQFDTLDHVNGTYQSTNDYNTPTGFAHRIQAISTTVARAIFRMSSNNTDLTSTIDADLTLVNHMLYCFAYRSDCPLFRQLSDRSSRKFLLPAPVTLMSDTLVLSVMSRSSLWTSLLFAYTGGVKVPRDMGDCKATDKEKHVYTFYWFPNMPGGGECWRSTTLVYRQYSPAFELGDYSGRYPTWTESRWAEASMRLFIVSSPFEQFVSLACGLCILIFSFVIVFWLRRNIGSLFDFDSVESSNIPVVQSAPAEIGASASSRNRANSGQNQPAIS